MKQDVQASLQDFVESRFGTTLVEHLACVRRGGLSNKKGSDFESAFAVYSICLIAASNMESDYPRFTVSCQEPAFVDDFCMRNLRDKVKTNYQLKNATGATADWNASLEARFRMQEIIDREYHEFATTVQILVVSTLDKHLANSKKIKEAAVSGLSMLFPYEQSSTHLVIAFEPLRNALMVLCGSSMLSRLDTAFRIILGQWHGHNGEERSVHEILAKAKASSHPDVFLGLHLSGPQPQCQVSADAHPPEWLSALAHRFHLSPPRVDSGAFVIDYNGMQVTVAANGIAPSANALAGLTGPRDALMLLMSLEASALTGQRENLE